MEPIDEVIKVLLLLSILLFIVVYFNPFVCIVADFFALSQYIFLKNVNILCLFLRLKYISEMKGFLKKKNKNLSWNMVTSVDYHY